jgi:hypothetical protein
MNRLERLHALAAEPGVDELAVLCLVAERLKLELERYGALHVATDRRHCGADALEAVADGLVYAAALMAGSSRCWM